MRKIVYSLALLNSLAFSQQISVTNDWQLIGATENIDVSNFDNTCIDVVWKYSSSNGQWSLYKNSEILESITSSVNLMQTGNIEVGEGFWIKGKSSCVVDSTVPTEPSTPQYFTSSDIAGKTLYPWGSYEQDPYENRLVFKSDGSLEAYHSYWRGTNDKVNEPWGPGSYVVKDGKIITQFGEGTCYEFTLLSKNSDSYTVSTRINFMCSDMNADEVDSFDSTTEQFQVLYTTVPNI